jgi:hypothetical protein
MLYETSVNVTMFDTCYHYQFFVTFTIRPEYLIVPPRLVYHFYPRNLLQTAILEYFARESLTNKKVFLQH